MHLRCGPGVAFDPEETAKVLTQDPVWVACSTSAVVGGGKFAVVAEPGRQWGCDG